MIEDENEWVKNNRHYFGFRYSVPARYCMNVIATWESREIVRMNFQGNVRTKLMTADQRTLAPRFLTSRMVGEKLFLRGNNSHKTKSMRRVSFHSRRG